VDEICVNVRGDSKSCFHSSSDLFAVLCSLCADHEHAMRRPSAEDQGKHARAALTAASFCLKPGRSFRRVVSLQSVDESTFEDYLGSTFTYSSSDQSVIEVKENGGSIPVTCVATSHAYPFAEFPYPSCVCVLRVSISQLVEPPRVRAAGEGDPAARVPGAGAVTSG
jgi:hypothetical protein